MTAPWIVRPARGEDFPHWLMLWRAYCASLDHAVSDEVSEGVWSRILNPASRSGASSSQQRAMSRKASPIMSCIPTPGVSNRFATWRISLLRRRFAGEGQGAP